MTILDNILAGIIAALVIALAVLLILNADLRADIARADANGVALSRANADLKNATAKQNAAIAALQKEIAAKTRAAEKAVKLAALGTRRAQQVAAAIAREPMGGSDCAAATHILRDYLTTPVK